MTGFIGEQLELMLTTHSRRTPSFRCTHILPDRDPFIVDHREELPTCLLHEGHDGDHLIITWRGKFFFWSSFWEYVNDEAEDDGSDDGEVIESAEVSAAEALRLLVQSPILIARSLTEQQP